MVVFIHTIDTRGVQSESVGEIGALLVGLDVELSEVGLPRFWQRPTSIICSEVIDKTTVNCYEP